MDLEEVEEDFTLNGTSTSTNHTGNIALLESQIYTEFFTLMSILNFCVDALIIHIIRTFKKLQLQTRNHYILHITLVNAMNMAMMLVQRILNEIEAYFIYFLLTNMELVFFFGEFMFYALMTIDWVLEQYGSSSRSLRYKRTAHFQTLAVYLTIFAGNCLSLLMCFFLHAHAWFTISVMVGGYGLLSVSTVTVSVVHYCKKEDKSHDGAAANHLSLKLATIATIAWITFFVGVVLLNVPNVIHSTWTIYLCAIIVTFPAWKPIVNFYVLYTDDRNFRGCLAQVFRCISRTYADDTQNLDGNEATVSYDVMDEHLRQAVQ